MGFVQVSNDPSAEKPVPESDGGGGGGGLADALADALRKREQVIQNGKINLFLFERSKIYVFANHQTRLLDFFIQSQCRHYTFIHLSHLYNHNTITMWPRE